MRYPRPSLARCRSGPKRSLSRTWSRGPGPGRGPGAGGLGPAFAPAGTAPASPNTALSPSNTVWAPSYTALAPSETRFGCPHRTIGSPQLRRYRTSAGLYVHRVLLVLLGAYPPSCFARHWYVWALSLVMPG